MFAHKNYASIDKQIYMQFYYLEKILQKILQSLRKYEKAVFKFITTFFSPYRILEDFIQYYLL